MQEAEVKDDSGWVDALPFAERGNRKRGWFGIS